MDKTTREALAQRLGQAEAALQQAQRKMDGSLTARTRLEMARTAYRAAEHQALQVLGARVALEVVEQSVLAASPPHPYPSGGALPR
ncbi:hypothetical protein [Corallococcus silvisoli]|uniref:hypothetical protein n=1 Tax=Corallococcus silvisoli TaxID=2697031 RepID=UPI0013790C0F|nr:hypothetical protein [Corallococcus silvisoli]NBD09247.1 hypothetical protein [Corallococcus silvisoli]